MTKNDLIFLIILAIFMTIIWILAMPGEKAYNKHACAVVGYKEDCKTLLAPEEKLK